MGSAMRGRLPLPCYRTPALDPNSNYKPMAVTAVIAVYHDGAVVRPVARAIALHGSAMAVP